VWDEASEDVFKYPFRFWQSRLVSPRSVGKDPGIGLTLTNPVRLSCVLPGYHERPGRYFLPSGFLFLYRFTKLLTNPFSIFYLLLNFKLPILVLIWGLEQKELECVSTRIPTSGATFHSWKCLNRVLVLTASWGHLMEWNATTQVQNQSRIIWGKMPSFCMVEHGPDTTFHSLEVP
jgi:hypothetical protein